jgi:chorismate synthase
MTFKLSDFTVAQLQKAITIKEKIEKLENELNTILGGISTDNPIVESIKPGKPDKNAKKPISTAATKRKRTMSAEGKAKMAASAKARWAKHRAEKNS